MQGANRCISCTTSKAEGDNKIRLGRGIKKIVSPFLKKKFRKWPSLNKITVL